MLFSYNILMHDTAVHPGMSQDVGYVTDADVDGQRFWHADIPQFRYFSQNDPFGVLQPPIYGNNRPVGMGANWYNIDPRPTGPEGFASFPYQGNLRFRHNKETVCNAGFADGHVEGIVAKINPDKTMKSHTALRKYFMIKWPSGMGIHPNPNYPS